MDPESIADYQCVVGEGPLWHEDERVVYWSDIVTGRLFRYDPASGHHEQVYSGEQVGGFTIQEDGALLLFMERGKIATWRDGTLTTLLSEIPAERPTRFNDVIADPRGRVYCGTISPRFDEGAPDGMTMDAEGCVWSARWGGGCLVRYATDGTELQRIRFPARKVSSAIFGGPDLSDLYVTTAGGHQKDVDGPGAGALFRVRPGVKGTREFRSRIGL